MNLRRGVYFLGLEPLHMLHSLETTGRKSETFDGGERFGSQMVGAEEMIESKDSRVWGLKPPEDSTC